MTSIYGIDRRKHPHLYGCLTNFTGGLNGKGNCFHRSTALVLDLPHSKVVMGTFRAATPEEHAADPRVSLVPFIHCWVEVGGYALPPTLIESMGELVRMPVKAYRDVNDARDIYTISRADILKLSGKHGISSYLRRGTPLKGGPLGDILLAFAGVPHQITQDSSVLPLS